MDMQQLRKIIDEVDDGLLALFQERMDIAAEIARHKKEHGLQVHDPARERQKLLELTGKVAEGRRGYVSALFSLLFEMSRADQERIINPQSAPGVAHVGENT